MRLLHHYLNKNNRLNQYKIGYINDFSLTGTT
nr:MAG TPA: hypothetical protein [Bacteriophage sp.]DAX88296.1 MAG TPA: hypothetical protein [Caudoviricetes sp.]